VALDFLDGNRLSKKDSAGSVYSYTDADGTIREIPRRRLFKITGFTLDGKSGVSAISYGAQAFGGAIAANKAATTTLSKGMTAKIAFLVDRIVHQDKRDEYREYLDKHVFGPMNAGEPVIMEKGMDAKVLSINPKDAQLIETRGFNVEDVCRFFRVDPSMIGHGNKDSNWGTGLEQKMISFLTFTLSPWLIRIEEALNNFLIPPADQNRYYFEFNIEGLLRADSTSRANFYQIMVNHGIMTRDQVRVKENWPQMGGNADKLTVNSAQILLDDLGKKSDADRVRSALAEWLKSEEKPDEK
jgi:HK97 family phage portal protein